MMQFRHSKCIEQKHNNIELNWHPQVIREKIKNLMPEQFGYNGFGKIKI